MAVDGFLGILAYGRELRKNERLTRSGVEAMQRGKLSALVRYAKSHSEFYGKLYRDVDPGNFRLADLPVIDKDVLMEHFDTLVTDKSLKRKDLESFLAHPGRPLYGNRYYVMSSGGSSGKTGIFVYDRKEWRTVIAGTYRWTRMIRGSGIKVPRTRVASVTSPKPEHPSHLIGKCLDIGVTNKLNLYAGDDCESMIYRLNAFQPEVLIGYSSMVDYWASAQIGGRLRIRPRVVATNSELRTPAMEANIETAWGVKPFCQYSMTELLSLSSDCAERRGIHVFEDLGIVEAVDGENRPVPDGTKSSRILVTNLYNFTQPIIRYRIDDMLTMEGGNCPCGMEFRRITAIHGREAVRFRFRDRKGRETVVTSLDLLMLLESEPGIREYQVLVDGGGIHLAIVADGQAQEGIRTGLTRAFTAHFDGLDIPVAEISVSFVDRIERNPKSGKRMPFIDGTGS